MEELTESACVLIDGPKGDEAIKIALKLLKKERCRAVFIHDLHRNTLHRDLTEILFNDTYFSDSDRYVSEFEHIDDPCWDYLDDEWGPYPRAGEEIKSYESTFGVFFNSDNSIDSLREDNYLKYLSWNESDDIYRIIGKKLQSYQEDGGPITTRITNGIYTLGRRIVR